MSRVTAFSWALVALMGLAGALVGCGQEARPLRGQDTLPDNCGGVLYLLGKVEGNQIRATDLHESLGLTVRHEGNGREFLLMDTRKTVRNREDGSARTELPEYVLASLPIGTYRITRCDYEDSFARAGFEIDRPVLRFHVTTDAATYIGLLAYRKPALTEGQQEVGGGWIEHLDETDLAQKDLKWSYPNVFEQIHGKIRAATYLAK
jgi:hypothetical protein